MEVFVKILNDNAKLPTYGSAEAAGADLYAATIEEIWIPAHDKVKIGTGIAMELPRGIWGGIFARSGLADKQGLRPSNCVGVIDSDYRGEILVSVRNDTDEPQCVAPGSRIAQLILLPVFKSDFMVVEELSDTDRGESGFGSTGTK